MPTMKKVMQFVESPLDRMVRLIESGRFETGRNLDRDFDRFSASMKKTRHPESLTFYSKPEYQEKGARLFKVDGEDAGYALTDNGEIISVFNNSGVRDVAPHLIKDAMRRGGNHLDHYGYPKHNEVYGNQGLMKYGSFKFDPKYNEGWDVERLKTPDYVYRGTPEYILEECADPSNELCNDFGELPPKLYEELMLRRKNFGKR